MAAILFIVINILHLTLGLVNLDTCPRQGAIMHCSWKGLDVYRMDSSINAPGINRIVFDRLERGSMLEINNPSIKEIIIKFGSIECKNIHCSHNIIIHGCRHHSSTTVLETPTAADLQTEANIPKDIISYTAQITVSPTQVNPHQTPLSYRIIIGIVTVSAIFICLCVILVIYFGKQIAKRWTRNNNRPELYELSNF